MIQHAFPPNIDDILYWLSQPIYVTRMQVVISIIGTIVFTWIASRMLAHS